MALKKKFFEVELPIINQKAELLAKDQEELEGRCIKIDLTRRLRGKSLEITFKIKNKKAIPCKLYLLGYYLRRMIRKSIDYVEDSFSVEAKNAVLRVKTFLITRKKVSRAVRKTLRNKAKEEINQEIKEKEYEEIFSDIISSKFQKNLSLKLKKIYPLSLCEIKEIYVEKEK